MRSLNPPRQLRDQGVDVDHQASTGETCIRITPRAEPEHLIRVALAKEEMRDENHQPGKHRAEHGNGHHQRERGIGIKNVQYGG